MTLLTQELRQKFPPLYANENKDPDKVPVICKFFNPCGQGTWWATEFDGEDTFFGLASIFEPELGYFSLKELQGIRLFGGALGIERDLHLGEITLAEAMRREGIEPFHAASSVCEEQAGE